MSNKLSATSIIKRFDTFQVPKVEKTKEGYLRGKVIASRAGVFEYLNFDGTVRRELRHPDEVFKTDSLDTMKMIPVTDDHPAEFVDSLIHCKGALAAARLGDGMNPRKESSGSQFYIVQGRTWKDADLASMEARSGRKYSDEQKEIYRTLGGTPHLDGGYTVFGQLIEGMDVLDKIAKSSTGGADRPTNDVRILKAGLVK